MSDITYPLFPIFAFLGFLISLIPLPWHLHAWNSGTCYYMMWAGLACLNQFVNSIVWHNNALNPTPFWCEICEFYHSLMLLFVTQLLLAAIRIMMGATVGLPLSSMCISRRLYHITSSQTVSINRAQVCVTRQFRESIKLWCLFHSRKRALSWLTPLFVSVCP